MEPNTPTPASDDLPSKDSLASTATSPTEPSAIYVTSFQEPNPPATADNSPKLASPFVPNFFSVVAVMATATLVINSYTDYFEEYLTLLSLGGLLAWVPFLLRLVPEDRFTLIQDYNNRFFEWPHTWKISLVSVLFGLVLWQFVGTIEVQNRPPSGEIAVWVYECKKDDNKSETLAANGTYRKLVWTSWWSPAVRRIKLAGLPEREVTAWPAWIKSRQQVPYSFLRPVVLIDFTESCVKDAIAREVDKKLDRLLLHVKVNEQELPPRLFDGHPVWIGAEALELPDEVRKVWEERKVLADTALATRYLAPKPHVTALILTAPQTITAVIKRENANKEFYPPRTIVTRQPQSVAEVVQLLTIRTEK